MATTVENTRHLFLDHQATTPVADEVLDEMLPYFGLEFGNASARNSFGRSASSAVEHARGQVAELLGAEPAEVVFTSGATESNAIAIRQAFGSAVGPGHLITSAIEHPSVLGPAHELARSGHEVTFLPVDRDGLVDPEEVRASLRPHTRLVSIMHANNEVGTIQELDRIGEVCLTVGVPLHSDMTQTAGNVAVTSAAACVSLASVSAHKFYGPKGVGALLVRRHPGLTPRQGAAEAGLRPGTLNVPGIVGLGAACTLSLRDAPASLPRVSGLRDRLGRELDRRVGDVRINGHRTQRTPGNLSVTVTGVEADEILRSDPALGISLGSACTSGRPDPSHVLLAMGVARAACRSTMRIGVGRGTTWDDCEELLDRLVPLVESSRRRNCYVPTAPD